MSRSVMDIVTVLAGQILEQQRGLNTPERRIELALQIEAAIQRFLEFEKDKVRQNRKPIKP